MSAAPASLAPEAAAGSSHPLLWLGAPSPGGLALPSAAPAAGQLYAPRGVWLEGKGLIVADSGNHRLLLWRRLPETDHAEADLVLGQPDFASEGPRAGGRSVENGFHLPTGVMVAGGGLWLADAWHHRILVWRRVPERSFTPPDFALGQPDLTSVEPNRGGSASARGLYWPYGLALVDGVLWVADTGNRRLLGWLGLPEEDRPADFLLGQGGFDQREENRGGPVSAGSFRWPHAVAGTPERLFVADAGNHRLLGWRARLREDRPAQLVLGQPGFETAQEMPHLPQGPRALRFPYGVAQEAGRLAVADTANNRVLLWQGLPGDSSALPDEVLGQVDFERGGENRWTGVAHNTLCWPYGIALAGSRLAVADSGNNRVMIWQLGAGITQGAAPGR